MKIKVAVLADGEWFRRVLKDSIPAASLPKGITAEVFYKNGLLALAPDEALFRFFYYDCPPLDEEHINPLDGVKIDFATLPKSQSRKMFLSEMGRLDFVALRLGKARARGWTLHQSAEKRAFTTRQAVPLLPADIYLNVEQKGVDMRIGIDVATLALKRIVDRIILLSGDTDMIPAMKLARREGVQVVIVRVANLKLARDLMEDADLVRCITPTA